MKRTPIILAIDPATQLGWATYDGTTYLSGSVCLVDSKAHGLMRDENRVAALKELLGGFNGVVRLIFEGSAGQRYHQAMKVACQLEGVMLGWAHENKVLVESVAPATVKKWAAGSGRAGKLEMVEAAKKLTGVDAEDDNEADALCICAYAVKQASGGE